MKIEKVNDHQIRCTLTKADLAARELKLSELAYGTDKAKDLFRDMIQQASLKYGFEAEDIPLMIEAIPLNADCIVLIITKVEDPEELDTRFSKFAPSVMDDEETSEVDSSELLDLFNKIKEEAVELLDAVNSAKEATPDKKEEASVIRVFAFESLYDIIKPASLVSSFTNGQSCLYKDSADGTFYLVVTCDNLPEGKDSFNRTCNILSEYGKLQKMHLANESYFNEHYDVIMASDAIKKIAQIN